MRLLYDAVLPQSLAEDAPSEVELDRWKGGDKHDSALIHTASDRGYSGVLFYDRDSLEQTDLREIAFRKGVALVAVEGRDPIEAKLRVLRHLPQVRQMLADHDCLLVLANEVRVYSG